MNILFVSAEVSPFAKVGGLADVAGSLPKELLKMGHDVRIVMPLYKMTEDDPRWNLQLVADDVFVPLNGGWSEVANIWQGDLEGVPVYFVGSERFFQNATSSDKVYTPGIEQYLFFSSAVLQIPSALGWKPEVVHCNDWHTGMIPVLMREKFSREYALTASIFTIHNLAYQGEFGVEILDAFALPRSLFVPEKLETWGGVNFLKAGCVYSDHVNTVSPTYAKEIQTPEFGCKLEGLMAFLAEQGRLTGILNGIGTDTFDPAADPHLSVPFSAEDLIGKEKCREALLAEVGMSPIEGAPLLGVVTRLSSQKGLDLLAEAGPELFDLPVQLIVQGLGDPAIADAFRRLQKEYPKHIRFCEKFDESLAQQIYGGSNMFLMPSAFEPCGLGQMIALRYGAIPIVRATGGLADTVFEGQNGFVFREKNSCDLIAAVERAHEAYSDTPRWTRMVEAAMREDHGWAASAAEYEALYASALRNRLVSAATA